MMISIPIKKVLDLFSAESDSKRENNDEILTNRKLLQELTDHFRMRLEEDSLGERMLYPMSFNVLMTSDDYEAKKQQFVFVLPEIVKAFYAIILEKKKKYPDFTPPSSYWFFQFNGCKPDSPVAQQLNIRAGHITTTSSLYTLDLMQESNVRQTANTRVSVKLDDSNVMRNVNLNREAVSNLDIVGEGTYKYAFDMTLTQDVKHISTTAGAPSNGLAELSYTHNGTTTHFTMEDSLIHISGSREMRKGRSFFIVDSESIKESHIQIRYVNGKFEIAAFGKARLNSRLIPLSSGGEVLWCPLANNSSIFINDELSVRFEIKSQLL